MRPWEVKLRKSSEERNQWKRAERREKRKMKALDNSLKQKEMEQKHKNVQWDA